MTSAQFSEYFEEALEKSANDRRLVNREIVVDAQLRGMTHFPLYRNPISECQFKLFRSTLLSWVISST